ncbi:MAG: NusG domain II-containing protein [Mycoplasmatales bacterium]
MKQAIIVSITLILMAFVSINFLNSDYITTGNEQVVVKKDGETIYKDSLGEDKIVWVLNERGNNLILTNNEIIKHFNFDQELDELTNVNNIDYQKIINVSGRDVDVNMLIFENASVKMYEANCYNKICNHVGSISKPNQLITCAPHKFVVSILGDSELDG